jgi:dTDP-4-dehydrorhamnose reductase
MADIDRAERERGAARAIKVDSTCTRAAACTAAGALFVYFSSDAVFSGTADCYGEEDVVGPLNWYGHTKAEREKAVYAACPAAAPVRPSLALGFFVTGAGNSFFAALESELREGLEVACPANEIRAPIDVLALSERIRKLLAMRPSSWGIQRRSS